MLGFDRVKRGPWDLLLCALASCLVRRSAGAVRVVPLDEAVEEVVSRPNWPDWRCSVCGCGGTAGTEDMHDKLCAGTPEPATQPERAP